MCDAGNLLSLSLLLSSSSGFSDGSSKIPRKIREVAHASFRTKNRREILQCYPGSYWWCEAMRGGREHLVNY